MTINIHPEVSKVISYMERNVPAQQLKEVARAVARIADLLWLDADQKEEFVAFEFISADVVGEQRQPISNGQDR